MKKLFRAVRNGDIEAVKSILSKQPELLSCIAVSPPQKDAGQSLLQIALKTGNFTIADYLIDAGIDIHFMEDANCGNSWRAPVIHDAITAAVMSCRWNTYSEEFGLTVFSNQEIANAAFSILEKLLKLGADVNAKDSCGNTGLWRAFLQASQIMPRVDSMTGELSTERLFTSELQEDLRRILKLLFHYGADLYYVREDIGMTVIDLCGNKLFDELL